MKLENRLGGDPDAKNSDQNSKLRAMLSLGSDGASFIRVDEDRNLMFKTP